MGKLAFLTRPIVSLCVVLVFTGCARNRDLPTAVPPKTIGPIKAAIDSGDVIEIKVFKEKDLSGKFQVADDGTIDYPLVGRVKVQGLVPPVVAKLLRDRLANGYLRSPHVRVLVEGFADKKLIYVWGKVQKSGAFRYTAGMPLIKALALAGGLTTMADRDGITVSRISDGKTKRVRTPMANGQFANYPLKPGDVIHVPERVF
jgi:protein involved in polysaccharide export with SLBB domain